MKKQERPSIPSYKEMEGIEGLSYFCLPLAGGFLFCAKCSHSNVVIRLIEMRKEENVQKFQFINSYALFDCKGEHMDSHGNIFC